MDQQLLLCFVASCAYLFLKMLANSGVQGYARFRHKQAKYAEDAKFFGDRGDPTQRPQLDIITRADAAWRNDLENIPMFIVAALCGLMVGLPFTIYRCLLVVFCLGRTVHTVSLLGGWQPWRFLGYLAGIVSTGTLFILSLRQFGW